MRYAIPTEPAEKQPAVNAQAWADALSGKAPAVVSPGHLRSGDVDLLPTLSALRRRGPQVVPGGPCHPLHPHRHRKVRGSALRAEEVAHRASLREPKRLGGPRPSDQSGGSGDAWPAASPVPVCSAPPAHFYHALMSPVTSARLWAVRWRVGTLLHLLQSAPAHCRGNNVLALTSACAVCLRT